MLLSLDLSTACTGWALFDSKTKELLEYGVVKPKVQPSLKKDPILFRVTKLQSIADQLYDLIIKIKGLKKIVIEEIVRGKNRINQKLLDGLHWVILTRIVAFSEIIEFIDVIRWRKALNIVLTDEDKKVNAQHRKLNKTVPARGKKYVVITHKHIAQRFVNEKFNLSFNLDKDKTHSDMVDAIAIGWARLHRKGFSK